MPGRWCATGHTSSLLEVRSRVYIDGYAMSSKVFYNDQGLKLTFLSFSLAD